MAGQDPPKSKMTNALGIIAAQGYMGNLGAKAMAISKNARQNYLLGMVNAKQRYARENENDPESGRARIHYAATHGEPDRVRELVRLGANVEMPLSGKTPLMLAAEAGDANMVRVLCELGAKVNAVQSNGETALHLAVYRGNADVVNALLDCGADVRVGAGERLSVLQLAAFQQNPDMIRLLLARGAASTLNLRSERLVGQQTPLHTAIDVKCLECVKLLVEAGSDLSVPNAGGESAFQQAEMAYKYILKAVKEDEQYNPHLFENKEYKEYKEEQLSNLRQIVQYLGTVTGQHSTALDGGRRRKRRMTRRYKGRRRSTRRSGRR